MNNEVKKSVLLHSDEVIDSRNKAVSLFQFGHYDEVVNLLESFVTENHFESHFNHEFSIYLQALFKLFIQTKNPNERKTLLIKAIKILSKTPNTYNSYFFDKGIVSYYRGDMKRAFQFFTLSFKRSVFDKSLLIPLAKMAFLNKDELRIKAYYHFLGGSPIPEKAITALALNQTTDYDFKSLSEYNLGFGAISFEDMNKAVKNLELYQNRKEALNRLDHFIVEANIKNCEAQQGNIFEVGKLFYINQSYNLAAYAFEQIPEENIDFKVNRDLAFSYYQIGEYEKAIELYDNLTRQDSAEQVKLYLEMAEALTCIDDFGKAQKKLHKANSIEPENPEIKYSTALFNYLRFRSEKDKSDGNTNLWAKYLRNALNNIEEFKNISKKITPEQFVTIDAINEAWKNYQELKRILEINKQKSVANKIKDQNKQS